MHLLPAERAGHRVIDGERVCEAIAAITPAADIAARVKYLALLSDPTRLTLLTCVKAAGPAPARDTAIASISAAVKFSGGSVRALSMTWPPRRPVTA